jgi:hypothetical protein
MRCMYMDIGVPWGSAPYGGKLTELRNGNVKYLQDAVSSWEKVFCESSI